MDLKSTLRAITLELRRELEGKHDAQGRWQPGDLERRLAAIGVRRDRPPAPVDELSHLSADDREARRVVDAYIHPQSRGEADQSREAAIAEFVREAAYSWANRLLALRCMEARGLIDEVVLQKDTYGGRSLQHQRLARKEPERCSGEDEGLLAVLFDDFARRTKELPLLFDPNAPEVALRPSVAVLKRCIGLLSGTIAVKGQDAATDDVFTAPDALGWSYQAYQLEEKDRVDAWLKSKKGFKCEGADLIPKTALYTEPYMVRFLVQNSLGALWTQMRPDSKLYEKWAYYVRDAERAPAPKKQVSDITFLDPACGSGHFLVEAFELFYAMYLEEGAITDPAEICSAILDRNLFGIDIDEHAVQIAALALLMKAKERVPNFVPRRVNLVATNIRLPAGKEQLEAFLRKHPEDEPLKPALGAIFEGLAHADELGSLLQVEEPVDRELHHLRDQQLERERKAAAGTLFGPRKDQDWTTWRHEAIERLRQHFSAETPEADLVSAFFGEAVVKGLSLVDLLSRRYDVVAANPPYLGSKSMGGVVKRHIQKHFVGAKRDLYAAFILRCMQLSGSGRTAMVTQQSWMFLKQMHRIRAAVLAKTTVEVLGHLGPGAFEEISGAHVNVALFVLAGGSASPAHNITAVRTSWDTAVSRRSVDLAAGAKRSESRARFRVRQSALASLPGQTFVYWCSSRVLELLRSGTNYEGTAQVGYTASANQRFVRFHWEVPATGSRWRRYSKGGGFRRWAGLEWYVVDWGTNGERPAAYVREHYAPDKYSLWMKSGPTLTPAIVWSEIGSGAMGARFWPAGSVISRKGPGIMGVVESDCADSLALLNARISTHLLRVTCSGLEFAYPYVATLHRPKGHVDADLVTLALRLSEYLATVDPCEREYIGDAGRLRHVNAVAAVLATVESILDDQATYCFALDDHDRKAVNDEVGVNAGSLPVIEGLDSLPSLPGDIAMPEAMRKALAGLPRRPTDDIAELTPLVLAAYAKAGGDRTLEPVDEPDTDKIEDEESDAEADVIAVHPPIPAATAVEASARTAGIHPISAYWMLQSRSSESVRERSAYLEQRLALLMLRLMGHRWPSEIERGARAATWADGDGIIPITEGTSEPTFVSRVRSRIADEISLDDRAFERDFQEVVGKHLSEWLAGDLFERHVSQFKKRPVVWQIESAPASNGRRQKRGLPRRAPAFSCLVYYHRLDSDLLPKLRTQYVGPLRTSFQTELTTLERLKNRSADQDARRLELEEKVDELREFNARLEQVIIEGFASSGLDGVAAREPLDKWTSPDGRAPAPSSMEEFLSQERRYAPDLNDGVQVNIAPLQRAGLLAVEVLAGKDVEKPIAERAEWRADERRWCREGRIARPGWWPEGSSEAKPSVAEPKDGKVPATEGRP